jgi:hypothetical protein
MATILPWPTKQHAPFADALLEFQLDGRKERFLAEIKTIDRRIAVAQVKEQLQALINEQFPGYRPLLITAFATTNLAEECRTLGWLSSIQLAISFSEPTTTLPT